MQATVRPDRSGNVTVRHRNAAGDGNNDPARVVTGTRPPVRAGQPSLLTTTNPDWIICAGQLLVRVFAALVVAAHNGPARSLWAPSLNLGPLTSSISIMGCGVVREYCEYSEYWLQFICNRDVNSCRLQFTPTRTVC
jgi:hypothetical protein